MNWSNSCTCCLEQFYVDFNREKFCVLAYRRCPGRSQENGNWPCWVGRRACTHSSLSITAKQVNQSGSMWKRADGGSLERYTWLASCWWEPDYLSSFLILLVIPAFQSTLLICHLWIYTSLSAQSLRSFVRGSEAHQQYPFRRFSSGRYLSAEWKWTNLREENKTKNLSPHGVYEHRVRIVLLQIDDLTDSNTGWRKNRESDWTRGVFSFLEELPWYCLYVIQITGSY